MKEYEYFENSVFKVIMREIHEELLENKEKSPHELSFMKMLKDLSFIKPNKIRIPGRDNLAELEQVWEIVCRCTLIIYYRFTKFRREEEPHR